MKSNVHMHVCHRNNGRYACIPHTASMLLEIFSIRKLCRLDLVQWIQIYWNTHIALVPRHPFCRAFPNNVVWNRWSLAVVFGVPITTFNDVIMRLPAYQPQPAQVHAYARIGRRLLEILLWATEEQKHILFGLFINRIVTDQPTDRSALHNRLIIRCFQKPFNRHFTCRAKICKINQIAYANHSPVPPTHPSTKMQIPIIVGYRIKSKSFFVIRVGGQWFCPVYSFSHFDGPPGRHGKAYTYPRSTCRQRKTDSIIYVLYSRSTIVPSTSQNETHKNKNK